MKVITNRLNLEWVSDKIGEDYIDWEVSHTIIISSQTGTGKTTFCLGILREFAEKNGKTILYICNRVNLKRQTKLEIFKSLFVDLESYSLEELDKIYQIGNVTIESYQNITNNIYDKRYGKQSTVIDESFVFDYIIYDECHYVFQDASFNNKTTFFFDDFLKHPNREKSINIFMSATMDYMKKYVLDLCDTFSKKQWVYNTGNDYSYITPYYFKDVNDMVNLINEDESDKKWLVITSIDKGKLFLDDVKDSKFICSEYNNIKHKKTLNEEEKMKFLQDGLFECKCLVATKAIDNGISLVDPLLTNIVVITTDKIDFMQMIGRVRVNINDAKHVNLYIMDRGLKTFTSPLNGRLKVAQDMIELYNRDINNFNHKYDSNLSVLGKYSSLFYRDNFEDNSVDNNNNYRRLNNFKINKTCAWHIYLTVKFYAKMISLMKKDKNAFIKEQLLWIGKEYDEENWIYGSEDVSVDNLVEYLESIVGERVLKEDQEKLTQLIFDDGLNINIGNNNSKKYKILHVDTLNSILKNELSLPYQVTATITSRRIDGKPKRYTYWTVIKTIEE